MKTGAGLSSSLLGAALLLGSVGPGCGVDNASVSSTAPLTVPASGGAAAAAPAATPETGHVSFTEVNARILQPLCVSCHSGQQAPDLTAYDAFAADPKYVNPGDPSRSLLYAIVELGSMPKGGPRLNAAQQGMLRNWIAAGAPND